MRERVQMRLPVDLLVRVDEAAGVRGRTAFVVRALESALKDQGAGSPSRVDQSAESSAPTRASLPRWNRVTKL